MNTHESIPFDPDLIRRYDTAGPRYTSYPTAVQFHDAFTEADYRAAAARSNTAGGPLSIYVHVPFCDTVCYYCGCNKVVTKDRSRAAPYVADLAKELALQSALFTPGRPVDQLHFGGGTPTFLSNEEMRQVLGAIAEHFTLKTDDRGEYSIEIDPREADAETVAVLRSLGFNRLSLGVQDIDPKVQQAVNRIQPLDLTRAVLDAARAEGFHGVSFDLIYGLPHQTPDSFRRTLDAVIELAPDRLSLFNYAHLPTRFKPQRRINAADLPSAADKLKILGQSIEQLSQAGYLLIGMDHFARPDDPLARAQADGTLHRNFQGYSTHAECDMVAVGVSSISQVGGVFSQNTKDLVRYHEAVSAGQLPIDRGYRLTPEDHLRQRVIMTLISHFRLDFADIEAEFAIDFPQHFAASLAALAPMQADGLLSLSPTGITIHPRGKLLIRNICMAFDEYLNPDGLQRFSRVI
ncbi:oxygen-independent coproporphyrinogen III oxidase [Halothiobacillus sp. DCM-1]|uniref:oxygen-independent coproporphyrinogen III oxidase n=1 Tax=Halothiobacillus sp. DCM-1 TaxID=3112558 RepID=UPI003256855E